MLINTGRVGGSALVESESVAGLYVWVSIVMMASALISTKWAHHAFRAVVCWSVTAAIMWLIIAVLPKRLLAL